MSGTTLKAMGTVVLIFVGAFLFLLSNPTHQAEFKQAADQIETYVDNAKAAAETAIAGAQKGFDDTKEALSKISGS